MPSVRQLSEMCVPLVDQPAYTKRKLRVVTIGAGFSGLIMAHKIQHERPELQEFIDHVIYEKNDGIGGTWRVNTYPGILHSQCLKPLLTDLGVQNDVPAHIYAFPFDPNPNWSKFYADGSECLSYMEHVADKWDLKRNIHFNTQVVQLDWLEEESKWNIKLRHNGQEREEKADIILSAQGFLSQWKWPSIPGIHDFKGHKVHSADWDHSFDYAGKKIGIIGNGSSAIQILPQMAKLKDAQIVSFQRNPTWITPSLGETLAVSSGEPEEPEEDEEVGVDMAEVSDSDEEVGSNFNPRYTRKEKRKFNNPEKHKEYRKMLQHGMNRGFKLFSKGSQQNAKSTNATIERMRKALNYNEELCSKLIPEWTLGCRRLTPGEGYLESFLLPNVALEQSSITKITPTGIQSENQHHDLDVIVCATGFDVSHIPHYPVTGREGVTLAEQWKDEPESYLSLACPNMPNYFIFTGPNATVGHGTLITSMTWSADWMIKWLRKIAREDIKSVCPTQSATDQFVRYGDEIHKTLVWTGSCKSWYKNHRVDGRVTATFSGSALLYREMIEEIRPEDFDIRYGSANKFRFMGNGFTILETQEDADLAFYVKT